MDNKRSYVEGKKNNRCFEYYKLKHFHRDYLEKNI